MGARSEERRGVDEVVCSMRVTDEALEAKRHVTGELGRRRREGKGMAARLEDGRGSGMN